MCKKFYLIQTLWESYTPVYHVTTILSHRVAVQNERYDDWSSTLVQLRRLFMDYQRLVLEYHKKPGIEIPKAVNSTAAQGNFLEVLNMSLNGMYFYLMI